MLTFFPFSSSVFRQHARAVLTSSPSASSTGSKPLSLEYMADRIDTDDPLWGFTVRRRRPPPPPQPLSQQQLSSSPLLQLTAAPKTEESGSSSGGAMVRSSPNNNMMMGGGGEMQGFVTVTTFTTWCRWFRWDSTCEVAGLKDFPKEVLNLGPASKRVGLSSLALFWSCSLSLVVCYRCGGRGGRGGWQRRRRSCKYCR